MIKAVVFDLDGTLLNTIQDLANAANHALRTLGLPEQTTEEFLHFVGDGRRNMVLRMLPEACLLYTSSYRRAPKFCPAKVVMAMP